jgi:hypothetical protein
VIANRRIIDASSLGVIPRAIAVWDDPAEPDVGDGRRGSLSAGCG